MFFRRPKHTTNDNIPFETSAAPSSVGPDTVFEGNLAAAGEVRIGGTVRGSIRAQICIIEASGLVEGEIVADEIIVLGRVVGPLRAYHVHLHAGAHVEGDVINETIAIDSGAQLQGAVWRSEDPFAGKPVSGRAERPREQHSYLANPLWNGTEVEAVRPLVAVRPK